MPIDPSVILAGKSLDTATPINDLAATQRQNTLDTMALKSANLDQMSKQNIYATQLLSAAAGSGDQNLWTTTKQHLQQNGIDTSNVPDDIASGKSWADAARLAQSPYGSLLNAAGKMDANAAAAAGVNGTTVVPNALTTALLRNGTFAGSAGGGTAAPAKPVTITRDTASAPAQEQPSADIQQTQKTIQAHYDGMTPRDQSRIQSVSAGAAGLMPFLQNNDSQGALNYLQQRKAQLTSRMGSGEGIDTQDTDAAIQMLKDGKIDELKQSVAGIMAYGQTVGHLPQEQDYLTQLTNAKAPQGFVPPPQQANENPAAYDKRVGIAKQAYDSRPDVISAKSRAEASGTETGKAQADASKAAIGAGANYDQVVQTINGIKNLNDSSTGLPQDRYGIPAAGSTWFNQNFGDQKLADNANSFTKLNEAQTIGAIKELASTGQIRMTRTLENILNRGYLIEPGASKTSKDQQAELILAELNNSKIAAQNVNAGMNGGQPAPYQTMPVQTAPAAAGGNAQPAQDGNQSSLPTITSPNDPAFAKLPSGAQFIGSDGIPRIKH